MALLGGLAIGALDAGVTDAAIGAGIAGADAAAAGAAGAGGAALGGLVGGTDAAGLLGPTVQGGLTGGVSGDLFGGLAGFGGDPFGGLAGTFAAGDTFAGADFGLGNTFADVGDVSTFDTGFGAVPTDASGATEPLADTTTPAAGATPATPASTAGPGPFEGTTDPLADTSGAATRSGAAGAADGANALRTFNNVLQTAMAGMRAANAPYPGLQPGYGYFPPQMPFNQFGYQGPGTYAATGSGALTSALAFGGPAGLQRMVGNGMLTQQQAAQLTLTYNQLLNRTAQQMGRSPQAVPQHVKNFIAGQAVAQQGLQGF